MVLERPDRGVARDRRRCDHAAPRWVGHEENFPNSCFHEYRVRLTGFSHGVGASFWAPALILPIGRVVLYTLGAAFVVGGELRR